MTKPRRGFTLLELMIAVAVLAIVSLAVLGSGGDTVRQLADMEERTLARQVAENQVAELRLRQRGDDAEPMRTGTKRERVLVGRRVWQVVRETSATAHDWLHRVEVSVYRVEEGEEIGPIDILTAFVGRY